MLGPLRPDDARIVPRDRSRRSLSAVRPGPLLGLVVALGLALTLGSAAVLGVGVAERNAWPQRGHYRDLALQAQQYTWRTLAYLGDGAADCQSAPYVTYRRDTRFVTVSDHWYVAVQLLADAALVRLGEERLLCQVDKTVPWIERLWDPGRGGFAPRADLDGGNPTLQELYADDNAIVGLALVEAARVTRDPTVRARALDAAERAAAFLTDRGLWDNTYGGGLWWTDRHGAPVADSSDQSHGKPAQSTALMAHLMAELHAETGRPHYRERAEAALDWLDRTLWDAHHGLYAYAIDRPPGAAEPEVVRRYFGYDQAIVVQALLRLHRSEPSGGEYLARARALGRATDRAFWHPELGGYTLEAGIADLYAPYGAWVSQALLDLYAADGDPFWRDRARANLDALERVFRGDEPGAYYRMTFPCVGERVSLCRFGGRWGLDRNVYTMTQALIQHAAALQAAAY